MFLKNPKRSLRFSLNKIQLQYVPPISNIIVTKLSIEKYIMNDGFIISDFNELNDNDGSNTCAKRKGIMKMLDY